MQSAEKLHGGTGSLPPRHFVPITQPCSDLSRLQRSDKRWWVQACLQSGIFGQCSHFTHRYRYQALRTRAVRGDEEPVRLPRQPRGNARPGFIPIRLVMLMRLLSSVTWHIYQQTVEHAYILYRFSLLPPWVPRPSTTPRTSAAWTRLRARLISQGPFWPRT